MGLALPATVVPWVPWHEVPLASVESSGDASPDGEATAVSAILVDRCARACLVPFTGAGHWTVDGRWPLGAEL
eukprot:9752462-Heterocapsa_arctica.AAC.1